MSTKRTSPTEPATPPVKQDEERHPVARLGETIGRLPRYLGLARELVRDPQLARWRKVALGAGLVYVVSPIDLVPGVIPVAGQLDDLAALLLALRLALRGCTPEAAAEHLRVAGVSEADIARDLANVRGAAGWIARRVARGGVTLGRASLKGIGHLVAFGADRVGRVARAAANRRS